MTNPSIKPPSFAQALRALDTDLNDLAKSLAAQAQAAKVRAEVTEGSIPKDVQQALKKIRRQTPPEEVVQAIDLMTPQLEVAGLELGDVFARLNDAATLSKSREAAASLSARLPGVAISAGKLQLPLHVLDPIKLGQDGKEMLEAGDQRAHERWMQLRDVRMEALGLKESYPDLAARVDALIDLARAEPYVPGTTETLGEVVDSFAHRAASVLGGTGQVLELLPNVPHAEEKLPVFLHKMAEDLLGPAWNNGTGVFWAETDLSTAAFEPLRRFLAEKLSALATALESGISWGDASGYQPGGANAMPLLSLLNHLNVRFQSTPSLAVLSQKAQSNVKDSYAAAEVP